MDTTLKFTGLIFGSIGMGYVVYTKNGHKLRFLIYYSKG